jgi:hypothetical protein
VVQSSLKSVLLPIVAAVVVLSGLGTASASVRSAPTHQQLYSSTAAASGCFSTGNPPFKLHQGANTIYAQTWAVSCTPDIIACKLGVAIWERGSATELIAENPGAWVFPCPIGRRVQVKYKCFNVSQRQSFYTEIFESVENDSGGFGSSALYITPEASLLCS